MNKLLIGCTLSALLISGQGWAQAQSCDCDYLKSEVSRLKAENAFLRKNAPKGSAPAAAPAASSPSPVVSAQKQTVEKVEYSLVRATGNIKTQTVQVDILVKNVGPTRDLQLQGLLVVDGGGEQYQTYDVGFGNTSRSKVTTGVPVKAAGVIKKILPSVKSFTVLTFSVFREDSGPGTPTFEFRNVPIVWK